MPLSSHSVGTYQETSSHATRQGTLCQSSQVAEPLWTDPRLKSASARDLISTLKKKCKWGMIVEHPPKILAGEGKATMRYLCVSMSTAVRPPPRYQEVNVESSTCAAIYCVLCTRRRDS